jgi:hypothetical protein
MNTKTQRKVRGWALTVAAIALIVAVIVGVNSCGSDSTTDSRAVANTATAAARPATTVAQASAILNFTPTDQARGAHGTVTVAPSGKKDVRLTISLAVPSYATYGVALWTDKRHLKDLYTGAKGINTQTMAINTQTFASFKSLVVGYQEVGTRIVRRRSGRHRFSRVAIKFVNVHELLNVSTGELLNNLVTAQAK